MKKKRNKIFNTIFYNNKYLLIFSVVLAVIIWVAVVIEFSPENEYVVYNVPININTKETSAEVAGLHPFGTEDMKVDITISGPRYSIRTSDISADDFKVEAVISDVTTVGEHNLMLKYSIVDRTATYSIESISKESVTVYFDNYTSEKVLPLELKGLPEEEKLAVEGTYCEGAVLSQNSITLSGATYQINALGDKVYAVYDSSKLTFPLKETASFDIELLLQDEYGRSLEYVNIIDGSKVTCTIPVLEIKNVQTSVTFKNVPKNNSNSIPSNITYTISPQNVDVAAASDVLMSMSSLDIGVIDFCEIKPGTNTFTIDASKITSAKIADENVDEFTITLYADSVSSFTKSIPVSCVEFKNIPDGYRATLTSDKYCITNVTFVGPVSELENLNDSDITVSLDMGSMDEVTEGINEIGATISVDINGVWTYGKYTVAVNVQKT